MTLVTDKIYTQSDIDNFIADNIEESIHLDFKRSEALQKTDSAKKEIAKDVSAFANSDGGIIVYGIEESNHKAYTKSFIDGNLFTKETLEQIINSKIQRRIDGIIIDPIRYEDKIEQTIYVVKIPRSKDAPHMCGDYFYRRFNFQSVKMEEYEIRDSYNRIERAKLSIQNPLIIGSITRSEPQKLWNLPGNIGFTIKNESSAIEKLYKLEIKIPISISNSAGANGTIFHQYHMRYENNYAIFSIPNKSPIFQDEVATIATLHFEIKRNNFEATRLPIYQKLYYSNGTEENSFILLDSLFCNDKPLAVTDFI